MRAGESGEIGRTKNGEFRSFAQVAKHRAIIQAKIAQIGEELQNFVIGKKRNEEEWETHNLQ